MCKYEHGPPSWTDYNANVTPSGYTEQISNPYSAESYALEYIDLLDPCDEYDGWAFTVVDNELFLKELDNPGEDQLVGILYFPDYQVTLDCEPDVCSYVETESYEPTYQYGEFDLPYAKALMNVSGETMEEPCPACGPVDRPALAETRWSDGSKAFASPRLSATVTPIALSRPRWVRAIADDSMLSVSQTNEAVGDIAIALFARESGASIPDALVRVLDIREETKQISLRSARTAGDGQATLRGLTPGTQEILVLAAGYGRYRQTITVTTNQTTYVPMQLWRSASVSGVVHDRNGQPVAGASIRVEYAPVGRERISRMATGSWMRGSFKTSQEAGAFRVLDINAFADFRVVASHPEYGEVSTSLLNLEAGAARSDVVIIFN